MVIPCLRSIEANKRNLFERSSEYRNEIMRKMEVPKGGQKLVNFMENKERVNIKSILRSCLKLISTHSYGELMKNNQDLISKTILVNIESLINFLLL